VRPSRDEIRGHVGELLKQLDAAATNHVGGTR
jgi:hypothetical protein